VRSLVPKLLGASIVLLALVWVPNASAAPAVTGKFELGTEISGNNKIVAGPDGNMWFTLPGKKVGDITPAGVVKEFELTGIEETIGIAVGPEGRIWVVATGKAVSFLPSNPTGTQQKFESALINGEPNIVLGPEGLFWVASTNKVAKFSPSNFNGTIVEVPVTGAIKPKDIDVAGSLIAISDSEPVGLLETSRVVTFTSAGVQKDFTIPGASQGLAGAPTGQIAYSAAGAKPEQAGLITPPSPVSAFELIGDPFGVAYGSDQAFWIVEFAKGGLERLTSGGVATFLPGLPVESARQIAAGPNNTLWVTLTHKEKLVEVSEIARISGLEPPVPPTTTTTPPPSNIVTVTTKPVPDTSFGKGPKKVVKVLKGKANIKFSFSSTVAGSTFQCRLFRVPTGKGKRKKPHGAFTSCRSPKVLHVAPGRYRFGVRAVAAGVTDASAAERAFTVVRIHPHR
jgi:streptogramin lyase